MFFWTRTTLHQPAAAAAAAESFSRVRFCAAPQTAAHQAPRPWDSPGKSTGVGCHFLLQCMKVKSESEVAQSCLTLSDPMDCSPPGSSAHGIFQARVLEWGAIAFSATLGQKYTKSEEMENQRLTQVSEKEAHILAENEAININLILASSTCYLVFLILSELYIHLDFKKSSSSPR